MTTVPDPAITAIVPNEGHRAPLRKMSTGIGGLDNILQGGLPASGVVAISGDPGAGKTVLAMQLLVNGFRERGDRSIFVAFEEPVRQIRQNLASFDWGLPDIADSDISLVDARLPLDTFKAGAFDISGLLAALTSLIEDGGHTTVVFDGLDVLLTALDDAALERRELVRLSQWARERQVSAIVTVKSQRLGEREQQRADLLHYQTDCVLMLQGSLSATAFSRSIRVVKYRGSGFSASPAPYIIDASGIEVVGFANARLDQPTFTDRVSSGVDRLDALLDGGYLRGTCTLVSGAPGTSKTSLGASFLAAACERGEKSLLISFDESASQVVSNMRSIGIDLQSHVDAGLLLLGSLFSASRTPEEHFVVIQKMIDTHQPQFLVIDPLSAMLKAALPFSDMVCESILAGAKAAGITVLCTSLLGGGSNGDELSASQVSTIADTWLHLSYRAMEGERNRALTIVKSRGTAHSNQVSELILSASGIEVVDTFASEGAVLMGSARQQKLASDRREQLRKEIAEARRRFELEKAIADLRLVAQKAAQEVEWKEREAALLDEGEQTLRASDLADASERLSLRAAE
jgi:circadian clock protein KaiC